MALWLQACARAEAANCPIPSPPRDDKPILASKPMTMKALARRTCEKD